MTPAFEEVSGAVTPTISALEPDTCAIGDPDFDLHITGENFTTASIIYFAGHDEPTTLNEDGTVSTGINMNMWHGPDAVNVYVRNGTRKQCAGYVHRGGRGGAGRVTNFLRTMNCADDAQRS
jgi:hypothetical protein